MIEKIEAYSLFCDNCGNLFQDGDFTIFVLESDAWDSAKEDGWIEHHGKHICDECHQVDDNDNVVLKKFTD